MRLLIHVGIAAAAGVAAAFVAAVVIAIVELYLAGHGYGSIVKEFVRVPTLGVSLSVGDLVLLLAVVAVSWFTWRRLRRGERAARS